MRKSALAIMAVVVLSALSIPYATHAATRLCGQFDNTRVSAGRYIVQNNEWNDSIRQCLDVTDDGFTVVSGYHTVPANGAPSGYPSIFAGCHYGNCSAHSGLPLRVDRFRDPRTTVTFTTAPGTYDASYDLWFDTKQHPTGQNNGAELMIWADHAGPPRPVGHRIGTLNTAGAGWQVWAGRSTNNGIGWNVVSYVRQRPTTALALHLKDFTRDSVARGRLSPTWFLTSVQFGFEPWQGGPCLAVRSFSFDANG